MIINGFIKNKYNLYRSILERLKEVLSKDYIYMYVDTIDFLYGYVIDDYFEYTFRIISSRNKKIINILINLIYVEITLSADEIYLNRELYIKKMDIHALINHMSYNRFRCNLNFDDICDIEILLELL